MKQNTYTLTGHALNWAVAKCEGIEIVKLDGGRATFLDPADDGALNEKHINYSTDWAQGGHIIEREGMQLWKGGQWCASLDQSFNPPEFSTGDTPLIAVMRCYVESKLGSEVDIPEELLTKETA